MRIHSESVKSRDIRHVRQLSQREAKTKGRTQDGRKTDGQMGGRGIHLSKNMSGHISTVDTWMVRLFK